MNWRRWILIWVSTTYVCIWCDEIGLASETAVVDLVRGLRQEKVRGGDDLKEVLKGVVTPFMLFWQLKKVTRR